jgi:alkylated DNA nucleotide flippase Atl1
MTLTGFDVTEPAMILACHGVAGVVATMPAGVLNVTVTLGALAIALGLPGAARQVPF